MKDDGPTRSPINEKNGVADDGSIDFEVESTTANRAPHALIINQSFAKDKESVKIIHITDVVEVPFTPKETED